MKLRDLKYEGVPGWPPQPAGGVFDPHNPAPASPDLESRVLADVAIAPPEGRNPAYVELKVERQDGRVETRALWVGEKGADSILKLYKLLRECKGRRLRDLGDLELDL